MWHGQRTTLTTSTLPSELSDLRSQRSALSIEPLYSHPSFLQQSYRKALSFPQISTLGMNQPSAGPVYFVEDEEIDFERVLREEKIAWKKVSDGPPTDLLSKVFSP
jgi:transcription initiation factor TFIID subunit 6